MADRPLFPTKDERIEACDSPVTLNGLPAKVTGYNKDFATVTQLDSRLSAEWSWETAVHIAFTHGRFQSMMHSDYPRNQDEAYTPCCDTGLHRPATRNAKDSEGLWFCMSCGKTYRITVDGKVVPSE